MRIIKEGNDKTEYIFDCSICGCVFALSANEFSRIDGWGKRCPCCDNLLGKNDAFKDTKGIYSEENLEKSEKHKDEVVKKKEKIK